MLDIGFLSKPLKVGGLEFMDFQSHNFSVELTKLFTDIIGEEDSNVTKKYTLDGDFESGLLKLIEKYTGFVNISLELSNTGNLAMDTGYMNPNNILNIKDIENYFSIKESTMGQWFKNSARKVFKGGVDLSTGKVTGDYCQLPITLYINRNLNDFIDIKVLKKYKVSIAAGIAGAIIHEFGHAFTAVLTVHQNVYDNFIVMASVRALTTDEYNVDKVTILKDTDSLLDLPKGDQKEIAKLIESNVDSEYLMYFSKMIANRNSSRALSVGVPTMTSEVLADMYAVKMGFDKGLLGVLAAINSKTNTITTIVAIISSLATVAQYYGSVAGATLTGGILVFSICMIINKVAMVYRELVPGVYNTEYRRMKDILGQMIARLKENDNICKSDKMKMLTDIDFAMKVVDDSKSIFEGTIVQRLLGSIFTLGKFKYTDFEHYTQDIQNHRINALNAKFSMES